MHLSPPLQPSLPSFIIFLFRRNIREKPNVTGALWIPLIWFLIICSRQPSEWLNTFGLHSGAVTLEEGSPLDACVYFTLIAAGASAFSAKTRSALGNYSPTINGSRSSSFIASFHLLVRLSFRGVQAVDQGAGPSDHGSYRPDGTQS